MAKHALLPHVSEIQIRLDAATLPELFAEAARAVAEVIGLPTVEPAGPWLVIDLEAADHQGLLVAWLNELITRSERDRTLFVEAAVDEVSATHLLGRIRGVRIAAPRIALRRATSRHLRLDEQDGKVAALVALEL
jgi:SHS2 domain-containing protein